MRAVNKIVLASTNVEKFREFSQILSAYPDITLLPVQGLIRNTEKLDLVEKHFTYLENAIEKARLVNHGCHYPALADDSGLEVEALPGQLGPRSRRYALPKAGMNQDQANIEKLLSDLKGNANRSAQFVCTLALVIEGITITATSTLKGKIAEAPKGEQGFGYDPVFIPEGSNSTLAQLTDNEKNLISHRAKALHELISLMTARGLILAKP